jgi:AcrR family transcriptional regulator
MRMVYHSAMNMSSTTRPRLNQRRRTRTALVDAAKQAVQRGETTTIEAAAEAAGISRATAYRYFTSQQALLLEASLDAIGTIPDPRMVDEGPVESRVDAAIRTFIRMGFNHEPVLRTFLMLSLEQWLRTHQGAGDDYRVRKGRRIPWLDRALAPLCELPARQKRRLRTALSMLCGVEAMIVAKDICGCSAKEAEEASRWAAQAMLRAALEENPGGSGSTRRQDSVSRQRKPKGESRS